MADAGCDLARGPRCGGLHGQAGLREAGPRCAGGSPSGETVNRSPDGRRQVAVHRNSLMFPGHKPGARHRKRPVAGVVFPARTGPQSCRRRNPAARYVMDPRARVSGSPPLVCAGVRTRGKSACSRPHLLCANMRAGPLEDGRSS